MKKKYITNGSGCVPLTKFLMSVDYENNELYVLHREFPACLIYVEKDKTPLNFVVFDFYEEDEDLQKAMQILTSDKFKSELRDYVVKSSFKNSLN